MTSITELAGDLQRITAWQRTPEDLGMDDYVQFIIDGIKTLYIDTGRASTFPKEKVIVDDAHEDAEMDETIWFDRTLGIDEEKYVLLVAQIAFFKKVQSDVNNIVSYTTDAMSVANADKPYAHLQDTINNLENERRIVFYKMVSYSFLRA